MKKAANDNHLRQGHDRIFKVNEDHPVIETILSTKIKPKKVLYEKVLFFRVGW